MSTTSTNQISPELHAMRKQLYSAIVKAQAATSALRIAERERTRPEREAEDLAKAEVARLNSQYQRALRIEMAQ